MAVVENAFHGRKCGANEEVDLFLLRLQLTGVLLHRAFNSRDALIKSITIQQVFF